MNKIKSILFLLIFWQSITNAQTHITFRKVLGNNGYDDGYSAKQTKDKGYIVGGSTSSFGNGNNDMFLIKTDSMGIPRNESTYGGINVDIGKCVRQTADNGYIFVGYTNSFGAGGYDVYLVKTDSSLQTQWTKTYGGTNWDFGNCVEQTSDGGYIICGSTYSYGNGDADYYLIKTNSMGDTMWTKTFGDTLEDVANSVIQTTDGGYILTGTTKSMGDTLGDIYTIKTDSFGDTLWTKKFGGPLLDYGNDILQTHTGDYIVGGETQNYGLGNSDGIIVKYSSSGIFMNMYTIGLAAYDNINSIAEDAEGKIAMTGATESYGFGGGKPDMYFFIVHSDFTYFNSTTYGTTSSDNGFSVETTADSSFIICGITNGFTNGLDHIYLIKTDTMGFSGSTGSESVFTTNIQDYASIQKDFTMFPNPANNSVYINFKNNMANSVYNISITDVIGKEIKHFAEEAKTLLTINTNDLKDGIYLITLRNKDFSTTEKLIVHH